MGKNTPQNEISPFLKLLRIQVSSDTPKLIKDLGVIIYHWKALELIPSLKSSTPDFGKWAPLGAPPGELNHAWPFRYQYPQTCPLPKWGC